MAKQSIALQRAAVITEARLWIGTPYHPRGRLRGIGVDCAMLPAEVYAAVGLIPAQSEEYYPPDWHIHSADDRYLRRVESYARRVEAGQPGDMVLYRFGRGFAHGAIVVDWPLIIHAPLGQPVSEDLGNSPVLDRLKSGAARERRFYTLWDDLP